MTELFNFHSTHHHLWIYKCQLLSQQIPDTPDEMAPALQITEDANLNLLLIVISNTTEFKVDWKKVAVKLGITRHDNA